jgi:DNA-binding MarR family transcriptional regulator
MRHSSRPSGSLRREWHITQASEQDFLDQVKDAAVLRAALSRFDAVTATAARECHLTPQRYILLLMIKGDPKGTQRSTVTSISQRLQMPHNTVSELVTRAVAAGLIRREPVREDRRSVRLALTPEGERRLRCAVSKLADQRTALRHSLQKTSR